MNAKRVIVTGDTGMIGGHVLKFCLDNDDVSDVTVTARCSAGIQNSKLTERVAEPALTEATR